MNLPPTCSAQRNLSLRQFLYVFLMAGVFMLATQAKLARCFGEDGSPQSMHTKNIRISVVERTKFGEVEVPAFEPGDEREPVVGALPAPSPVRSARANQDKLARFTSQTFVPSLRRRPPPSA